MPLYLRHNHQKAPDNQSSVIYADNSPKPKMSNRRGATWDHTRMKLDNQTVKLYLDTTWGECAYFEYEGSWYRIPLICAKRMEPGTADYVISPMDSRENLEFDVIKRKTFLKEKDGNQPGPYEG